MFFLGCPSRLIVYSDDFLELHYINLLFIAAYIPSFQHKHMNIHICSHRHAHWPINNFLFISLNRKCQMLLKYLEFSIHSYFATHFKINNPEVYLSFYVILKYVKPQKSCDIYSLSLFSSTIYHWKTACIFKLEKISWHNRTTSSLETNISVFKFWLTIFMKLNKVNFLVQSSCDIQKI
jgi:hypothetical protein